MRKPNKYGCVPSQDACLKHSEPLACKHGCSQSKNHKCSGIDNEFIWITVQIVGTLDNYGYAYSTDFEKKSNKLEAYNYGLETLDHDDFLIGEVNRDGKVLRLFSKTEEDFRERNDAKELKEVNAELGF